VVNIGCKLASFYHLFKDVPDSIFTTQCYASAVYVVVVCLSVCHTPVLYQNG